MSQEVLIRKLVDFVLLNAYSMNSTGLYNGKVGLSLSLFCVARLLNDDYIEEQAYELLQETLLSVNKDISFENGIAGIGYVLYYLITNQFIEADFKEIFKEQANKIWKSLGEAGAKSSKEVIVRYSSVVHFLNTMRNDYPEGEIALWIQVFSIKSSQLLNEKFDNMMTLPILENKISALQLLESYVKLSDCYDSFIPDWNLLDKYGNMYRSGKFISNFTIGYHLKNLATRNSHSQLKAIAIENMERAVLNLFPDTMSLSQRIDFLYMMRESGTKLPKLMEVEEKKLLSMTGSPEDYERYILNIICPMSHVAGYQHGIARLLLYWVYKTSSDAAYHLFL